MPCPKLFHWLILVITVLLSGHTYRAPATRFHERAQPSSLDSFFGRAPSLVYNVQQLLDMAENQDVVEYCATQLENLLSKCVNLFEVIDRRLYNRLINVVHMFFLLHSYAVSQVEESRANSTYNASIHCSNIGRPRYAIMFAQLSYLVGENFNTRRIANCLGASVSTVR